MKTPKSAQVKSSLYQSDSEFLEALSFELEEFLKEDTERSLDHVTDFFEREIEKVAVA